MSPHCSPEGQSIREFSPLNKTPDTGLRSKQTGLLLAHSSGGLGWWPIKWEEGEGEGGGGGEGKEGERGRETDRLEKASNDSSSPGPSRSQKQGCCSPWCVCAESPADLCMKASDHSQHAYLSMEGTRPIPLLCKKERINLSALRVLSSPPKGT